MANGNARVAPTQSIIDEGAIYIPLRFRWGGMCGCLSPFLILHRFFSSFPFLVGAGIYLSERLSRGGRCSVRGVRWGKSQSLSRNGGVGMRSCSRRGKSECKNHDNPSTVRRDGRNALHGLCVGKAQVAGDRAARHEQRYVRKPPAREPASCACDIWGKEAFCGPPWSRLGNSTAGHSMLRVGVLYTCVALKCKKVAAGAAFADGNDVSMRKACQPRQGLSWHGSVAEIQPVHQSEVASAA